MLLSLTGFVCAAMLATLQCSRSLLVTATKHSGSYAHSPEEVLLAQEVLKLVIAVVLFAYAWVMYDKPAQKGNGKISTRLACMAYAIPALCYAGQNLIVFYALLYIDPPTFQLFTQLKIVTTALVFVLFQGRYLSSWQWLAVFLLLVASVLGQWKDTPTIAGTGSASATTVGFILSIIYCFLSTLSGAVRESLLKFSDLSMPLQQVIIYVWSVAINITICSIFHPDQKLFATDFDTMTWVVIVNGAVLGHITGAVAKYADNLISAFAAAISLFMSTGLSVWFFATQVNFAFFVGLFLSVAALFLYLKEGQGKQPKQKE